MEGAPIEKVVNGSFKIAAPDLSGFVGPDEDTYRSCHFGSLTFQETAQIEIVRQGQRLKSAASDKSEDLSVGRLDLRSHSAEDLAPLGCLDRRNRKADSGCLQTRSAGAAGFKLLYNQIGQG